MNIHLGPSSLHVRSQVKPAILNTDFFGPGGLHVQPVMAYVSVAGHCNW